MAYHLRDRLLHRLPLEHRLRMAHLGCRLGALHWPPALLGDLAAQDPAAFHRFVWEHNLQSSRSYLASRRFDHLVESRELLFADLHAVLGPPQPAIHSVLEAGCSAGYLLRHAEVHLCPQADPLVGFDVDTKAMSVGRRHLARCGSRVQLYWGDLRRPPQAADRQFDLVLCAGVLRYTPEDIAASVVRWLLRHTSQVLVLTGPAAHDCDNCRLTASRTRADHTYVHNFDAMVLAAGGRVRFHRWEGARVRDGQTIYTVIAHPSHEQR